MKKILVCLLFFSFCLLLAPKSVQAARLSFDPVTLTASISATFDVNVRVDTAGVKTTSSDARIPFDSSFLEVVKITSGAFYPQNFKTIGTNKVYIGGAVRDPLDAKTGTGTLSTITFRGKKLGTTTLSFECTPGKTTDSNITRDDPDATDALDCTQLVAGTYTIAASASASATPTATTTPSASASATPQPTATKTPTPTPAKIPVTGSVYPGIFLLLGGIIIVVIGGALII